LPWTLLDATQAAGEVRGPAKFGKLAVVHNVDATGDLSTHHVSHCPAHELPECCAVVSLAGLFRHERPHQLRWSRQAALVCDEESVCATSHRRFIAAQG
jgi:hypothetical protein